MLTVEDYFGDSAKKETNTFLYAKVDPNHQGGRPKLIFDSSPTELSRKGYPYLSSYTPTASDRVLCINKCGDIVVLGKII